MKRRRKNADLSTGMKIAIASAVGLTVGAVAAYAFASTASGGQTIDDAIKAIDDLDLRLPQPSMKVITPESEEEFATLDEVICEIGGPIIMNAPPGATIEEVVNDLQRRIALDLYPDFPWPPMSGDHPTVEKLWIEIGVLARRAVVTGTVCPEGVA